MTLSFQSLWAFYQVENQGSELDKKNLLGTWQCALDYADLGHLNLEQTYYPNHTFKTHGKVTLYTSQKIIPISYQATGQWSLNFGRILQIRAFKITQLDSPIATKQQLEIIKQKFDETPYLIEKITRLSSKKMAVQIFMHEQQDFLSKECLRI